MSKMTFIFPVALSMLLIGTQPTAAKSWRQITPLHSTAQDVQRLFPACKDTESRCQFTLEGEEVMVVFSGSKIGDLECKLVPQGTVLAVIVKLVRPKPLRNSEMNSKKFKAFDPSSPPGAGYKTYYDAKHGFMINTFKGQTIGLVYIANREDIHLCPEYYEDPKAFVEVGLIP